MEHFQRAQRACKEHPENIQRAIRALKEAKPMSTLLFHSDLFVKMWEREEEGVKEKESGSVSDFV